MTLSPHAFFPTCYFLVFNIGMLLASDQVYIATMNPTPVSGPRIEDIPRIFNKRMDPDNLYYMRSPMAPFSFVIDLGGSIPVNTLRLSKFCHRGSVPKYIRIKCPSAIFQQMFWFGAPVCLRKAKCFALTKTQGDISLKKTNSKQKNSRATLKWRGVKEALVQFYSKNRFLFSARRPMERWWYKTF